MVELALAGLAVPPLGRTALFKWNYVVGRPAKLVIFQSYCGLEDRITIWVHPPSAWVKARDCRPFVPACFSLISLGRIIFYESFPVTSFRDRGFGDIIRSCVCLYLLPSCQGHVWIDDVVSHLLLGDWARSYQLVWVCLRRPLRLLRSVRHLREWHHRRVWP